MALAIRQKLADSNPNVARFQRELALVTTASASCSWPIGIRARR